MLCRDPSPIVDSVSGVAVRSLEGGTRQSLPEPEASSRLVESASCAATTDEVGSACGFAWTVTWRLRRKNCPTRPMELWHRACLRQKQGKLKRSTNGKHADLLQVWVRSTDPGLVWMRNEAPSNSDMLGSPQVRRRGTDDVAVRVRLGLEILHNLTMHQT
eukprot:2602666-Rhodomonas_salina.1